MNADSSHATGSTPAAPQQVTIERRQLVEAFGETLNNSLLQGTSSRIEAFTGRRNQDVLRWLDRYEAIGNGSRWDNALKMQRLPLYLSDVASDWYTVEVQQAVDPPADWTALKAKLKSSFLPSDYRVYLRNQLRQRRQEPDEPVANYITAKRALCLRLNAQMAAADVMEHLFEGFLPAIARTLRALDPQNLDDLIEQAKHGEHGIRDLSRYQ